MPIESISQQLSDGFIIIEWDMNQNIFQAVNTHHYVWFPNMPDPQLTPWGWLKAHQWSHDLDDLSPIEFCIKQWFPKYLKQNVRNKRIWLVVYQPL